MCVYLLLNYYLYTVLLWFIFNMPLSDLILHKYVYNKLDRNNFNYVNGYHEILDILIGKKKM